MIKDISPDWDKNNGNWEYESDCNQNCGITEREAVGAGMPEVVAASKYNTRDYTVSDPETPMINKGDYTVIILGKNNYTGTVELPFKIKGVTMNEDNTVVTYSGISENGYPFIDVRTEGRRLTEGEDYTYSAVSENGSEPQKWNVTIYAIGNYDGGVTTEVEAGLIALEDEDVDVSANFIYTGEAQQLTKDQIVVTKGNKTLVEGTDYTVSNPEPAVNAGEYTTLSINGMGDYTGTAIAKAEIQPIAMTAEDVKTVKDAVYTGSTAAPEVEVVVNGKTLAKGTDYLVEVDELNVEMGQYTALVKGIGNYSGKVTVNYNIVAPTLDSATIVEETLPYTGSVQKPASITVMLGDVVVPADQYVISYGNAESTEVGTYEITAIGTGIYTGTATGTYQIVAAGLADATVTAEPVVYTGAKAQPKVEVKIGDLVLTEGTDYVVEVGNAVDAKKDNPLTIVGIGNYDGTLETTFDINPMTITASNVKVNIPAVTYNGKAQTPKNATVIVGSRALAAKDYTLAVAAGANRTNAGKVRMTLTGKGNYTGTVTDAWFTINKKNLSKGKVTGIKDKTYTGKALAQSVVVTLDGKKLTKSNGSLKVTYKNNKNIGQASLTITGKGNYTGTITGRTFKIFPKKAAIKSLKGGKNRFTVQAKKQTGGVSYQIQYKVKGSKSGYTRVEVKNPKKVIKGLRKGKTYTVKVRAYKKVGKKMYYGAFSKAKNVKVK